MNYLNISWIYVIILLVTLVLILIQTNYKFVGSILLTCVTAINICFVIALYNYWYLRWNLIFNFNFIYSCKIYYFITLIEKKISIYLMYYFTKVSTMKPFWNLNVISSFYFKSVNYLIIIKNLIYYYYYKNIIDIIYINYKIYYFVYSINKYYIYLIVNYITNYCNNSNYHIYIKLLIYQLNINNLYIINNIIWFINQKQIILMWFNFCNLNILLNIYYNIFLLFIYINITNKIIFLILYIILNWLFLSFKLILLCYYIISYLWIFFENIIFDLLYSILILPKISAVFKIIPMSFYYIISFYFSYIYLQIIYPLFNYIIFLILLNLLYLLYLSHYFIISLFLLYNNIFVLLNNLILILNLNKIIIIKTFNIFLLIFYYYCMNICLILENIILIFNNLIILFFFILYNIFHFNYFQLIFIFNNKFILINNNLLPLQTLFILLIFFLIPIAIFSNWNNLKYKFYQIKIFLFLIIILTIILILSFSTFNLFSFILLFETTTLPLILLISLFGHRSKKYRAMWYLFIYTLIGSIFMLGSLILIFFQFKTVYLFEILFNYQFFSLSEERFKLIWIGLFIGFAIKIPICPFHMWLPEAHVEAPTCVSIILAGILLKLGGYGIVIFMLPFFNYNFFLPLVHILCLISIFYSSFILFRETHLKKIIAYSSIIHMNIGVLGLFSNHLVGISGGIFMMFSHGFISSGLFFCAGIIYDRYKTYDITLIKNISEHMPLFSFFFVILIFGNMGLPLTSGFIGEFLILYSLYKTNIYIVILLLLSLLLNSIYNILLMSRILYGNTTLPYNFYVNYNKINLEWKLYTTINDLNRIEFISLFFLSSYSIIFGIFPGLLLNNFFNDFFINLI